MPVDTGSARSQDLHASLRLPHSRMGSGGQGGAHGVAAHADAEDRRPLAERPQAHQHPGMGERAPRGADHGVEPDAGMPLLRREVLVGGDEGGESVQAGLRQQLVVA